MPVVGPPDGDDWRYSVVTALVGPGREVPRQIGYYLTDGAGTKIRVETTLAKDSGASPPQDCSTDPGRRVQCVETVPGVYQGVSSKQRFLAFDSATTQVAVFDGAVADEDLDTLCASLKIRDARWLAARQSWLYRALDG